jgi:hypothetical protein
VAGSSSRDRDATDGAGGFFSSPQWRSMNAVVASVGGFPREGRAAASIITTPRRYVFAPSQFFSGFHRAVRDEPLLHSAIGFVSEHPPKTGRPRFHAGASSFSWMALPASLGGGRSSWALRAGAATPRQVDEPRGTGTQTPGGGTTRGLRHNGVGSHPPDCGRVHRHALTPSG